MSDTIERNPREDPQRGDITRNRFGEDFRVLHRDRLDGAVIYETKGYVDECSLEEWQDNSGEDWVVEQAQP